MTNTQHLLCFNCHEAWIAQLDGLPYELDILVGLPGRDQRGWDTRARPLPRGARLVEASSLQGAGERYDVVLVHNPSDLIAARDIAAPRLLILHNTLEGRLAEEGGAVDAHRFRAVVSELVRRTGAHVAAVSPLKAASWGEGDGSLVFGLKAEEFGPHLGTTARGLRVANHVENRRRILRWDLHDAAFASLPMTLVGANPGRRDSSPARSFRHLKDLMRVHRFYVHTADPALEDGYNLASLEAMASGLPVVGNPHPSSPVRHGIDGFLSDDPAVLRAHASALLADPVLASRMGAAARERVEALFDHAAFAARFDAALAAARRTFEAWRHSCLVGSGVEA